MFFVEFQDESNAKYGRPNAGDFVECSTSKKRRKLMDIRENYNDIGVRETFLCSLNLYDRNKVSEFMN